MPFILDDMLLMAALGAGGGALFNKKDPLKGALMGGALGGLGGAVVPGLLSAGGATGAATGAAGAGTAATGAAGATEAAMAAETGLNSMGYLAPEMSGIAAEQAAAPVVDMSTQAGLFDTMNYKAGGLLGRTADAYNKYQKPLNAAMTSASLAKSLMPPEQPIQGGLLQTPPATGPQGLQQLAGQNQQLNMQRQQEDMAQREKRRQMIARMRGY